MPHSAPLCGTPLLWGEARRDAPPPRKTHDITALGVQVGGVLTSLPQDAGLGPYGSGEKHNRLTAL